MASNEIRKIFKDHGNEEKEQLKGQRAINEEDFFKIPSVILYPTTIKLSEKLYEGKPVIEFAQVDSEKFNVSAVVSDKHMDLIVQTTYVNIKKGKLATPTGEQAPINTPEANSSTVSNNIIFENADIVKEKTAEDIQCVNENQENKYYKQIIQQTEDNIE